MGRSGGGRGAEEGLAQARPGPRENNLNNVIFIIFVAIMCCRCLAKSPQVFMIPPWPHQGGKNKKIILKPVFLCDFLHILGLFHPVCLLWPAHSCWPVNICSLGGSRVGRSGGRGAEEGLAQARPRP